jgi:hypothetical protein
MFLPALGRQVLYRLTAVDVTRIQGQRDGSLIQGNQVSYGQQVPAIIVNLDPAPSTSVNLHLFLDGTDSLWVTSRVYGGGEGQWSWPPVH